jgi:GNAT superfamily N-acetyltransferase
MAYIYHDCKHIVTEIYHIRGISVAEVSSQAEDTAMMPIVQRMRTLQSMPSVSTVRAAIVRPYRCHEDIDHWLSLRNSAFAGESIGGRPWDRSDFGREFLQQPWWRPEWMWFAFPSIDGPAASLVGTVTLAVRQTPAGLRPAVHWLCVLPEWRRRGVGSFLMATLERAAWNAGHRQIWLETHSNWKDAAAFYDRRDYAVVNVDRLS